MSQANEHKMSNLSVTGGEKGFILTKHAVPPLVYNSGPIGYSMYHLVPYIYWNHSQDMNVQYNLNVCDRPLSGF